MYNKDGNTRLTIYLYGTASFLCLVSFTAAWGKPLWLSLASILTRNPWQDVEHAQALMLMYTRSSCFTHWSMCTYCLFVNRQCDSGACTLPCF